MSSQRIFHYGRIMAMINTDMLYENSGQICRIMTSQNHTQGPGLSSCPPNVPSLLLPAFPGAALLVTSADTPGSKLIIKLKREGPLMGGSEELPRTQTFFLTGMPLGWATQRRDGPGGAGIRTVLLTKAGEEPGGRKNRAPEAVPSAQGSPSSDTSFACTSKGVYENYRRWQRYKALARRHFPATPDAEAVHQYAEIMEGLNPSWEEEEAEKKEQGMGRDTQDQEEGVFPDPGLLQYIDQLCDDEEFVCKVEAVIHPQFMVDLLSPEKTQDPLELVEELAEELSLTPSQVIQGNEI
ncbi:PREDICTED: NUT family member 1-like [Thamnophis sirtalis]|uniref:NUT family member 1-like n=1 Tax=Thamnophis sirtalis TaxID=35019 RepID=A0A6I9XX04_9SAUR|nr:PREDICTED: NUT family member 1-like [Thamnophis sirtalis]